MESASAGLLDQAETISSAAPNACNETFITDLCVCRSRSLRRTKTASQSPDYVFFPAVMVALITFATRRLVIANVAVVPLVVRSHRPLDIEIRIGDGTKLDFGLAT